MLKSLGSESVQLVSAAPFDTHAVVKELKAAGFTDDQAEAVTRVVRNAQAVDMSSLGTKADLTPLAAKIDVAETKAEILSGWSVRSAYRRWSSSVL